MNGSGETAQLHGMANTKVEGKRSAATPEVIKDRSVWIWHAFFETSECLNDIKFLDASSLLGKETSESYPSPCELLRVCFGRNK